MTSPGGFTEYNTSLIIFNEVVLHGIWSSVIFKIQKVQFTVASLIHTLYCVVKLNVNG